MAGFSAPTNLEELIREISKRPMMFCGAYTFQAAAAFIAGYAYARDVSGLSPDIQALKNFSLWLAIKLDRPKNWVWSATIKDVYPDDEMALERMSSLTKNLLPHPRANFEFDIS